MKFALLISISNLLTEKPDFVSAMKLATLVQQVVTKRLMAIKMASLQCDLFGPFNKEPSRSTPCYPLGWYDEPPKQLISYRALHPEDYR